MCDLSQAQCSQRQQNLTYLRLNILFFFFISMIFLELSHHHPQFILIFSSCEQLLCFLCALHSGRTACKIEHRRY